MKFAQSQANSRRFAMTQPKNWETALKLKRMLVFNGQSHGIVATKMGNCKGYA